MAEPCLTCPEPPFCGCDDPMNAYSLVGQSFSNSQTSFVVPCPAGFICGPDWPKIVPVNITFVPPVIPPCPSGDCTGTGVVVRIHCCQSDVVRSVPYGTGATAYAAIVTAMLNECAAQQAICDAINHDPPTPKPPPPPPGPKLHFTNGEPPSACVDSVYSMTFTVDGGTPPYTFTQPSGTIPVGLSLSSGGVLSGTVSDPAGGYVFQIKATDSLGVTGTTTFSITVAEITTETLDSGETGVAYSDFVEQSGGEEPIFWSIIDGVLPDGLVLDAATGEISGTPTVDGIFDFTIQMQDVNGVTCQADLQIGIGGWTIDGNVCDNDANGNPNIICAGLDFYAGPEDYNCEQVECNSGMGDFIDSNRWEFSCTKTFGPFATDKLFTIEGTYTVNLPEICECFDTIESAAVSVIASNLQDYSGSYNSAEPANCNAFSVNDSFTITGKLLAGQVATIEVDSLFDAGKTITVGDQPIVQGSISIVDA